MESVWTREAWRSSWKAVLAGQAAVTEVPQPGQLNTRNSFLPVLEAEYPRSAEGRSLAVSSHGRKTTSCVSSLQGTDPTVGSVSCSNRLPRPHLLTLSCSTLERQRRNLGDTNIQFIAEMFGLRCLLDLVQRRWIFQAGTRWNVLRKWVVCGPMRPPGGQV